jgi:hypothetical protein
MTSRSYDLHGLRVLECAPEGERLRTDRDAADLVGAAFEHHAALIVIRVESLDEDFFRLKTRVAGEIIQKLVNYRLRLAIVGDISQYLAESSSLRAFVNESNRGDQVWFLSSLEELDQRLAQAHPA